MKWQKPEGGRNLVLDGGKKFFISYLPGGRDDPFEPLVNMLQEIVGVDQKYKVSNGQTETALVVRKRGGKHSYHILTGDWRKEYEKLVPEGLKACMKFYEDHAEYRNNWSTETTDLAFEELKSAKKKR